MYIRFILESCPDVYTKYMKAHETPVYPQCTMFDRRRYTIYRETAKWIRQEILNNRDVTYQSIGGYLYKNATSILVSILQNCTSLSCFQRNKELYVPIDNKIPCQN